LLNQLVTCPSERPVSARNAKLSGTEEGRSIDVGRGRGGDQKFNMFVPGLPAARAIF